MEKKVRFALAQYKPVKGCIDKNLEKHKALCVNAANLGVDVITFPELSLTGYEPQLISGLMIPHSSSQISELSEIAVSNGLTIVVGCPLESGQAKPYIGAVIFQPNGEVDFYHKQYLHQGEDSYCVAGEKNYFFSINQVKISLAICADFTEPQHYSDADLFNADVYLVSALISKGGFSTDGKLLSNIAKKVDVPVLLSNFVGETGGWDTAGKSSVWDNKGNLVVQGSDSQEGLTLCSVTNGIISDVAFQPFGVCEALS